MYLEIAKMRHDTTEGFISTACELHSYFFTKSQFPKLIAIYLNLNRANINCHKPFANNGLEISQINHCKVC